MIVPRYLPAGQRLTGVQAGPETSGLRYRDGSGPVTGARTGTTEDGVAVAAPEVDEGTAITIRWSADAGKGDPGIGGPGIGGPDNAGLPVSAEHPGSSGERVRDVQGRPAYAINRETAVVVEDFHGGTLIVSTNAPGAPGSPPPAPLAELVKVAAGVHWVG